MAFTQEQLDVGRQVLAEANRENLPPQGVQALFEAGLAESGLRNLTYGDRDSQGVFQERPSQGWTNVRDIPSATQQIIAHMNLGAGSPQAIAQSAERSAFPDGSNYAAQSSTAQEMLAALGVVAPGGAPNVQNADSSSGGGGLLSPLTDFVAKYAVKVGLILGGGVLALIGMWIALGHPVSSLPGAVSKSAGGGGTQRPANRKSGPGSRGQAKAPAPTPEVVE